MIEFLPNKNIVVVTNGFMHLSPLLDKGITNLFNWRLCKANTNAFIGRGAVVGLELYRFDKCFMGVNGIHPQFGFTTPDQEEAMVKQKAISLSREAYVLADQYKVC